MTETLDDRMKKLERKHAYIIPDSEYFIARLDGVAFSKLLKDLKSLEPFNADFVSVMILTMNDLVAEFNPATGYTHSDEITLIFNKPNIDNGSHHIYGGKIQKITSKFAGYCSARFNYHATRLFNKEKYPEKIVEKLTSGKAYFDCRVITFEESQEIEVINHMVWRSVVDSNRNAIFTYGYFNFKPHELFKSSCENVKAKLLKEKNFDYDLNVPIHLKYGVYAKKQLYEKNVIINGAVEKIVKSHITNKCFIIKANEYFCNLIIKEKYFSDNPDFTNLLVSQETGLL